MKIGVVARGAGFALRAAADDADGDVAEFGFDVEAARMHLAHDGGGDGDVRFERFGGGVDHHALESGVGALPALFDRGGVVEVERHRHFDLRGGVAGGVGPVAEQRPVEVGPDGGEDDRRTELFGGLRRGPDHRGVGEVEHRHRVTVAAGVGEHLLE